MNELPSEEELINIHDRSRYAPRRCAFQRSCTRLHIQSSLIASEIRSAIVRNGCATSIVAVIKQSRDVNASKEGKKKKKKERKENRAAAVDRIIRAATLENEHNRQRGTIRQSLLRSNRARYVSVPFLIICHVFCFSLWHFLRQRTLCRTHSRRSFVSHIARWLCTCHFENFGIVLTWFSSCDVKLVHFLRHCASLHSANKISEFYYAIILCKRVRVLLRNHCSRRSR